MKRTKKKYKILLEKLLSAYPGKVSIAREVPMDCDIIVNATSAGLKDSDPLPVDPAQLTPSMIADWIRQALRAGWIPDQAGSAFKLQVASRA